MPTPAAGLFIASFPFLTLYNPFGIQSLLLNHWVLYAICLIVSWLMVSRIPLLNLKFKNFRFAENKARYSILIIAIISIPLLGWLSVPVIFFSYILVSLLLKTK